MFPDSAIRSEIPALTLLEPAVVERSEVSWDRAMIVRHGMWSLAGKITNLAVAFLNTALVARVLTPVDFADLNALRARSQAAS